MIARRRTLLLVALAVGTSACTTTSTPAQQQAQAAWDACAAEGRIPPGLYLSRIEENGRLWFGTGNDGTIGFGELRACLAEKRRAQPR